jgi:hypothetical protein
MDIKRINQLTGDILNYEQRVERLKADLISLQQDDPKFSACMTLRIDNCKRTEKEYSMNIEEVRAVLQRRLVDDTEILEKFKTVYENEFNEQPA